MAKAAVKRGKAESVATAIRWPTARREAFIAALARTANVVQAAREVDVPERSPYLLRRQDPAFAAAWDVAIEEGYQRLELLLLRRATFGEACDGQDAPAISTSFALSLLKNHQTRARRGNPELPTPVRGAALRDRIEAKLAELNRRLNTDD